MKIYNDITEMVGNTPLVKINKIGKEYNANIIAKIEYFNPSLSVKDRAGLNMVLDAEKSGRLKKGYRIIEATSGNIGIALATIAASRGYKITLVIPDTMSIDKINYVKALGADVVLTPGVFGMIKAFKVAEKLAASTENSCMLSQMTNKANPEAHIKTAQEIINDTDGKIDYFIAGAGTGGTITGTGKYLKSKLKDVKIVVVEPKGSAVLSGENRGPHKIQGIGAGFVPEILDLSVIDEIITVSDDDAMKYGRELAREEGIFAGISSGAAIAAALEVAKRDHKVKPNIVVLLPDNGSRYLNTELYNEEMKDTFVC